jgi:hypothetical protein
MLEKITCKHKKPAHQMTYGQLKNHLEELIFDINSEDFKDDQEIEPEDEILQRINNIMIAIICKRDIDSSPSNA